MVTTWPKYTTRNQIIVHHDTAHTSYSTTSFVHGKSLFKGVYRSLRLLLPILWNLLLSLLHNGKAGDIPSQLLFICRKSSKQLSFQVHFSFE